MPTPGVPVTKIFGRTDCYCFVSSTILNNYLISSIKLKLHLVKLLIEKIIEGFASKHRLFLLLLWNSVFINQIFNENKAIDKT